MVSFDRTEPVSTGFDISTNLSLFPTSSTLKKTVNVVEGETTVVKENSWRGEANMVRVQVLIAMVRFVMEQFIDCNKGKS